MIGDPSSPSRPEAPGAGSGEVTSARRVLLGELLVESKVITREQLAEVLRSPREPGKKLGQVLLDRGWITEAQLTQTLSLQLSVPWVSLNHVDFSRQLLNRLSREIAEQYCLIPIFVRHVKGQGETLYVAMDDPTNEPALDEVARRAGLPTRPMIASASDIRSAIRIYYGESTPGSERIEVPAPPTRIDGAVTVRDGHGAGIADAAPLTPPAPTEPEPQRSSQPGPAPLSARSSPSVPPSRSNPPSSVVAEDRIPSATRQPSRQNEPEPARRRPGAFNLTLLDGTTITLPVRKKKEGAEGLTARDFVSALRASAQGADASEVLGDQVKWEPIVAALISILVRKGLIADWEFIEELRKI